MQEVTAKMQLLVREEIELAKAEVTTKGKLLARGAVVVTAAGIFAITGLLFLLHMFSWLAWRVLSGGTDNIWIGFLVVTLFLFLLAGLAAFFGIRWLKSGSPPKPEMAIEEAQLIRGTLQGADR